MQINNINNNIKKLKNKKITLSTYSMLGIILGSICIGTNINTISNRNETEIESSTENNIENDDNETYHAIVPIKVYYEIKNGDTLTDIANKYNIKINSIKDEEENPINPEEILNVGTKVNFTYTITNDEILYATEQIEKDENVPDYILAFLYNTDAATINRLNENNLIPNTTLIPNFKGVNEIKEAKEKDIPKEFHK